MNDKVKHFLVGAAIAFGATLLSFDAFTSVVITLVIGVAKEVYDSKNPDKHTADAKDAFATVFGGVFGALIGVNVF